MTTVVNELSNGWVESTLGDIGKVSMCKRILKKQTSATGDIPFFKIGTFGKEPNAFITDEIYQEFKERYSFPKKGDILISASGTIGRRVIYDGKPAYFQDSNIVWIDNDEKVVLNEYLYMFYGACDWNPSKGATIARLYNDDLRRIKIQFPESLDEQKRIVALLDTVFADLEQTRAKTEQNLKNARELFDSYLQQVFSQKGEGWVEKTLGETVVVERGSSPRPIKKYQTDSSDGVNWIKIGDTKGITKYINSTKEKITKEGAEKSRKVDAGDFILSNSMSFGKPYIMGISGYIHDGWFVFRLPDYIDTEFFYYLLSSPFVQKQFQTLSSGAIVKNISGDLVKKASLPIPPLSVQKNIASKLDETSGEIEKLESIYKQKLNSIDELKKSILQKAFSGELTHE